jgi:hypothetical protein
VQLDDATERLRQLIADRREAQRTIDDLAGINTIITGGTPEPISPSDRTRLEEAWDRRQGADEAIERLLGKIAP